MEYLDILDSNGKPAGEKKSREEVHQKGLWHRTVHAWVVNQRDRVLIQKRSGKKLSYPNMWDISIAGHVEAGDDSINAAVREAREELGLELTAGDFKYLLTTKGQSVQNNNTYFNNEINDVYVAEKEFDPSGLKLQEEEVSEVRWIDCGELEKKIKNRDKNYIIHEEEYAGLFEYLKSKTDDSSKFKTKN